MIGGWRGLIVAAAAAALAACATVEGPAPVPVGPPAPPTRPVAPTPPPVAPAAPSGEPVAFAALPGWAEEDHAAALKAFADGCGVARDAGLKAVCGLARTSGPMDEARSRDFLEANFQAVSLGDTGLLTAYFAPEYEARPAPEGAFTAPVRGRPADLVILDLGQFEPSFAGKKVTGHVVGTKFLPYPDRAEIEASPPEHAQAWMKPEDLFMMQIQGSGVLDLPDGRKLKATFNWSNGRPFVGLARIMVERGLLTQDGSSADAIRAWLAAHRGPEADALMRLNTRYVFFDLAPDDGKGFAGAAGARLTPGRALAMDPALHRFGEPYWIVADAPVLAGAYPGYRRLAINLDQGSAIKGLVRADLYTGVGAAAGREAGRVRHRLKLYALVPVATRP